VALELADGQLTARAELALRDVDLLLGDLRSARLPLGRFVARGAGRPALPCVLARDLPEVSAWSPGGPGRIEFERQAAAAGVVSGRFAAIGRGIEGALEAAKGRRIPMNIDGATAVIYAEPVWIERPRRVVYVEPVYLRVPPGYETHWREHCGKYGACGRPVYFVREDWYQTHYVPHYQAQNDQGKGKSKGKGKDK